MAETKEEEEKEPQKRNVQIVVSSLGNERRAVHYRDLTDEQIKEVVRTIEVSFGALRSNDSLLLTGSDGLIVFINLENVAFIEVRVD